MTTPGTVSPSASPSEREDEPYDEKKLIVVFPFYCLSNHCHHCHHMSTTTIAVYDETQTQDAASRAFGIYFCFVLFFTLLITLLGIDYVDKWLERVE
jgi:hypothetical protein